MCDPWYQSDSISPSKAKYKYMLHLVDKLNYKKEDVEPKVDAFVKNHDPNFGSTRGFYMTFDNDIKEILNIDTNIYYVESNERQYTQGCLYEDK